MVNFINQFFDILQLLTDKLPILNRFIVELVLLGLVLMGAYALFSNHRT